MSSSKKKVCMLAATPLTIHFFLKPHLIELAKEYDVTLVLNLQNDSYLPPLDLPIEIIDISIARKISPLADLTCLFSLIRLFKKNKYDLLITVVPKAGLLGMLAGAFAGIAKRIHIFQGEVWANRSGFGRWLLKTCDQITATLATKVLAVSASEKDFLVREVVINTNRIEVLGKGSIGGVDLKRFAPNPEKRVEIRSSLGIPQDAIVILFMGRLVADKGIYELAQAYFQAVHHHPNLWLLLVGPDEEGELNNLDFGRFVTQVKRVPYTTEPESYLAASDLLCLPSHREGFGVVIIEAAATGIPAIGSKIYGISDAIIDGQTGLLFECANVQALQACIERLVSDVELRKMLGNQARLNVEKHFSNAQVVNHYIEYIRNTLNTTSAH
ncbi:glycosyltransferase family 4 protein [Polynucleobacter sp. MWH-Braz-FAM2G]|uniref:glycosyltransferase family 4 protein n=1 Tax=Polynucleobacter sp. MWH-Braz-FAM2G TaxID=1855883 RepID=UPI001BFEDCC8|nr:glycosyltransferase family 4 protein [Polynucleobacter sp. MWH-Braz-FAM2G]QWD91079.1 glycosyltransferase family 4 protein [Polynucleobacter sp. MWH-Braz-FAM2G]